MKTKMVQIRNVPEDVHAELCRRAKARRQSLSAYLLDVVEREAGGSDVQDLFAEIRRRGFIKLPQPAAEYVAEAREEREAEEQAWVQSLLTRLSP